VKRRWYGAGAGVTAAVAALGVAELIAVATGPQSAPLVAVGGAVVDSVPKSVKNFAVSVFYTYDKLALIVGTIAVLAVFSAVFGALALRHIGFGIAGIAVFASVGMAAALTRHDASWTAALPSLLGALAGFGVLVRLLRTVPAAASPRPAVERAEPAEVGDDPGSGVAQDAESEEVRIAREVDGIGRRRRFLQLVTGTVAGAALVGFTGRWLATRRGVSAARKAVVLPAPSSAASELPADADQRLPKLTPFVTENKSFYLIDTALVVPQVAPDSWTLKIHGRVRNPISLTYKQLLERPMIERYITLACVSNEVGGNLIGNARWLGVPVGPLLDEADPEPGADQVVSKSVDGFTAGTPTAVLRDGRDAMLAIGMNGVPLPIEHGFPVRMVVPGLYGYVSATKWLAELELTSFAAYDAYWIKRGWAQQAPIKTQSRIDTPQGGATPQAGRVVVAGVAWAQHRGVSKVEVRVDEGTWETATLAAVPSIDTWRQWTWQWDATPGKHRLTVRATDNAGVTQTEEPAPPDPDGATGWHSVVVEVR
jgi:DMSO/TMAO reductase YedYZ molybdopterin-dependent catalytic subunit